MNNKEYWSQVDALSTSNYKIIRAKLEKWKLANNITERCVVHHRDDTEECLKYNEEHYERWGFNEDGTFEYGKYVVFMTLSEHSMHHNTGERNSMYGKHHNEETLEKMSVAHKGRIFSDEHRAKISAACKGKSHSEESREKMSAAHKGVGVLYATYKNNGGVLKWNDFQKALGNGEITFEMQPITVYTSK